MYTPRHCNLIAYIPSRGCRWARDLRTDDDALHKRDSLNDDEDVKEDEGKKGHDGDERGEKGISRREKNRGRSILY